ncbi:Coproporphyrinogen III oxidase [Lipomyces oligophaga]|uniref:Coproporphyrinogen III oxidase n=1 Tax=Lipomyces oligophaga TaxID=45792 RepID=UPI0034CF81D9
MLSVSALRRRIVGLAVGRNVSSRGSTLTSIIREHSTLTGSAKSTTSSKSALILLAGGAVTIASCLYTTKQVLNESTPVPSPYGDIEYDLTEFPTGLNAELILKPLGTVYEQVPGLDRTLPMREQMEILLRFYQDEIIAGLERADSTGKKFIRDEWSRGEGMGGGITRVFQDGRVFEKGGVNFSSIRGELPPAAAQKMKANHKDLVIPENGKLPFYACGLSLVIHPRHYLAPSVHLNYRYFETRNADGTPQSWWFGGGQDLSPMYYDESDAYYFHKLLKDVCDYHDPGYYPRFKKWADEYFYIKFRGEARGIGGIFFDDLNNDDPEKIFKFVGDALSRFLPSYLPAVKKAYLPSTEPRPTAEAGKHWQGLRRGRYAEFNLAVDRGTQFGLNTPGSRVESILMTLPKHCSWEYNYQPVPGSLEDKTQQAIKKPTSFFE